MPARQGAVFWSSHEGGDGAAKSAVALCAEESWPIETSTVDRVLIVHGIHDFDGLEAMLQESWRVLTGQGRLILVVPNRSGIWARIDNTPFGQGVPYSMGQIRHALRENLFVPEQQARALFVPPTKSRLILATASLFEKIGARFFNAFGGVNIIEASKQVYSGHLVAASARGPMVARRRVIVSSRISSRNS
jgi:SAM-dependent methyltransferase